MRDFEIFNTLFEKCSKFTKIFKFVKLDVVSLVRRFILFYNATSLFFSPHYFCITITKFHSLFGTKFGKENSSSVKDN